MKKLIFMYLLGIMTTNHGMQIETLYSPDSCAWMEVVQNNPDIITLSILDQAKKTITKQIVCSRFFDIPRVSSLLNHAIILQLQKIQSTPRNDHTQTLSAVSSLCDSEFFATLPEKNKKRIAEELLVTKEVYPLLAKNQVLSTIITFYRT
ncbi:MAG TPA: hypothetical protein PLU71_02625 [Candidatus Dependentiae bacterium]|nr:hypothetical protein [Candidatus Dependentiae bacterium]HRQ62725.1 hypothetical protein [Candidatus Dependentiae bacterium]